MRDLYLEPLGLGVAEAALKLSLEREHLLAVLDARQAITPEIAEKLEGVFGQSAKSWLKMQQNFDRVQER